MANFVVSPKGVRAVTRLVRGSMSSTSPSLSPAAVSFDTFPAPFAVRWSQAQKNGDGAWVIWLPDVDKLVMFNNSYITIGSITPANSLISGYYTIDELPDDAAELWLALHIPTDPEAAVTSELIGKVDESTSDESTSDESASDDETVIYILVAKMSITNDGARYVKQFANSAVTLGGGGGGGIVDIDPNGIAAISMEYTGESYTDPYTSEPHPFNIKLTRGYLELDKNGALTITADDSLTQYIDTVSLSSVLLATPPTQST